MYDSPLKRGDFAVMVRQAHHARHYILSLSKGQSNDKGVCKFAVTHTQPLFLEGSLKAVAAGQIYNKSIVASYNLNRGKYHECKSKNEEEKQ